MKLLLDQNLSRRLLPDLTQVFPESTQVALLGLDHAEDIEIWRVAQERGFTIVTKDADFVELALVLGTPPKVVWLNLGNVANAVMRQILLAHAEDIRNFAESPEGVLEIE